MSLVADATHEVCIGAVLFTDLVGFTEYNAAVGDADAIGLLDEQSRIVQRLLDRRADARLVKELGDGLMLWFASADSGVEYALDFGNAVGAGRAEGSFPLSIRQGLHYGEALTRGDDVIGHTVNVAARVVDLAAPGEILVSADAVAACDHLTDRATLQPIGPAAVKGVREPIWLHRLSA